MSRSTKFTPDIKANLGRRTVYVFMGAGFHGEFGLKQSIKANMWMKYVVSRLMYGLEVLSMKKKQLEAFQQRSMKQIQNLPLKTSDTSALALLGILPIFAKKGTSYLSLEEF